MRTSAIFLVVMSFASLANNIPFDTEYYVLNKAQGKAQSRCGEGQLLFHTGKVLSLGANISFVGIDQGKTEEQVPNGCHYTFETVLKDKKLVQKTSIKNCELAGTNLTETLWQDKKGLHYQYVEEQKGKSEITTCDYTAKVGGQ